jgi:ApaG protein
MMQDSIYASMTDYVKVSVLPIYLETQSNPQENQFLWAYQIRIENTGDEIIQLRTRHWEITDALGRKQTIKGGGVVGEQPVIKPGECYEYTSGTPLTTPSGIMVGKYLMEKGNGDVFFVEVPAFSLDSPYQSVTLN